MQATGPKDFGTSPQYARCPHPPRRPYCEVWLVRSRDVGLAESGYDRSVPPGLFATGSS
jgi:hypothetical protein